MHTCRAYVTHAQTINTCICSVPCMHIHCIYMKPEYIHTYIYMPFMNTCMHNIHIPMAPPTVHCPALIPLLSQHTLSHSSRGDPKCSQPSLSPSGFCLCLSLRGETLASLRAIDCCTDLNERTRLFILLEPACDWLSFLLCYQ